MTADVQRELAEALTGRVPVFAFRRENPDIDAIAAALLPTVQALIADAEKRAAARALLAIELHVVRLGDIDVVNVLHVRRALDPSGAAEGAGR